MPPLSIFIFCFCMFKKHFLHLFGFACFTLFACFLHFAFIMFVWIFSFFCIRIKQFPNICVLQAKPDPDPPSSSTPSASSSPQTSYLPFPNPLPRRHPTSRHIWHDACMVWARAPRLRDCAIIQSMLTPLMLLSNKRHTSWHVKYEHSRPPLREARRQQSLKLQR